MKPTAPRRESPPHGEAARPNGPSLPHERDQQNASTAPEPDPQLRRAAQDLKEGQVDTDLRATPGLDADRRGGMVEGGEHAASQPPGAPQPARGQRKR